MPGNTQSFGAAVMCARLCSVVLGMLKYTRSPQPLQVRVEPGGARPPLRFLKRGHDSQFSHFNGWLGRMKCNFIHVSGCYRHARVFPGCLGADVGIGRLAGWQINSIVGRCDS